MLHISTLSLVHPLFEDPAVWLAIIVIFCDSTFRPRITCVNASTLLIYTLLSHHVDLELYSAYCKTAKEVSFPKLTSECIPPPQMLHFVGSVAESRSQSLFLLYYNDACSLFPVGARSDEMAVRNTSIFGKVYVFSDTVVYAFSEGAFGKILVPIRCPKTFLIRNVFS